MSLRALLYRRPSEPSVIQVVFDQAIYLVRLRRHRQARRYTLRIDASLREVVLHLAQASRRYASELGVAVKRISVRDQSSRWGSCSNTGVLSFSWRLVLAPPFVLDYLAAHEVCHLVELNHSPRFWRLVTRLSADTERAKAWLDVHGTGLHRYGAAESNGEAR